MEYQCFSAGTPKSFLEQPVTVLKGVGSKISGLLAKKNIYTLQDLLLHLPFRYQDRTRITPIRDLRVFDEVMLAVQITRVEIISRPRPTLVCVVCDGTGEIRLRFFNFSAAQKNHWKVDKKLYCYGQVRLGVKGLEMIHPDWYEVPEEKPMNVNETLTPIYSTTEGLSQKTIRHLVKQAFQMLGSETLKELPEAWVAPLRNASAPTLKEALAYCHGPPPDADCTQLLEGLHPMQQRLVFEEFLAHAFALRYLRENTNACEAPLFQKNNKKVQEFLKQLPFSLTKAQQRVYEEILNDLSRGIPMMRLLQGDVGCGKTVVAALAMLLAVEHGYQATLMVPTELLAEQHDKTFSQWFSPLGLHVVCLSGSQKSKERKKTLEAILSHEAHVIIGTHALIQETVQFSKLGLIVIDEQHRFGVHQRLALKEKGSTSKRAPHQLIMTATPIPRSLAMTTYGDLDCSIIDELPPERLPIKTIVISNARREEVIERVALACEKGRQVYWVCTLIEESEVLQSQAAEMTAQQLQQELPHCSVGLLHGRLPSKEKEKIMNGFKEKAFNLLVATTVVEVGVNVPNASLMIIENPERLGLAQLHQLRGRVGRGSAESHCVLMYQAPLSHQAKARLQVMRESQDGFFIAQKDLELRGPGELLGTRQTGLMQFKIADVVRDQHWLEAANSIAKQLKKEEEAMAQEIMTRWLGHKLLYHEV